MTPYWKMKPHAAPLIGKLLLLASMTILSTAGSGDRPDLSSLLTPSLDALAAALADSVESRCSAGLVQILEVRGDQVRINLGSKDGLRPFSQVTLSRPDAAPWKAEVASLKEKSTWLKPAIDSSAGPPVGTTARIRLNINRLALLPPELTESAPADIGLALAWMERLAAHAAGVPGFEIIPLPAYPDSSEQRDAASAAGAEMLIQTSILFDSNHWDVAIQVSGVRKRTSMETIFGHAMAGAPGVTEAAQVAEWSMVEPPPGLRNGSVTSAINGPILDIMSRRWMWSDVQVILDNRIEAWRATPEGLSPGPVIDLTSIWPAVVPTRWPVAEILPVNTYYDMKGEEVRVNYTLCSNQRPHYLTINVEKAVPDSLLMVDSGGPLDRLAASFGGCFRELDRVAIPANFTINPAMPKSALARLSLEEIQKDQAGQVLRTDSGQLRLKKVAILYHDEATASLWLSSAGAALNLPGTFGSEMDAHRAGTAGPPGFLVTSDAVPGEPDHLEWWTLVDGRCERKWIGPTLDGSITAILSGDRDQDERDDLILAVVKSNGDGYRSRLQLYSSRPGGVASP